MTSCKLLLIVLIFTVLTYTVDGSTVCSKKERTFTSAGYIYFTKYYCCSINSIEENGRCKECPFGNKAYNTASCKKCDDNTYGERCNKKCRCLKFESCDNIKGCIGNDMTTDNEKHYSTHTGIQATHFETVISSTEIVKVKSYPPSDNTVMFSKHEDKYTNTNVLIYIMCTGSLAFMIGLTILCRQRLSKLLRTRKVTDDANNVIHEDEVELNRNDSVYDLIDEQNMVEIEQQ